MTTRPCGIPRRWRRGWLFVGLLLLMMLLLLLLLPLLFQLLLLMLLSEVLSLRDSLTLRKLHLRSLRRGLVLHGIVGDGKRRVRRQGGGTVETAEEIL
jgi:hypothetical protein